MKLTRIALLAAMSAIPLGASAADDAAIRALREEIARMRDTYEKRIDALERRLAVAETATVAPAAAVKAHFEPVVASSPPVAQPAMGGAAPGTNAFNPNISLILSGVYNNLSKDPSDHKITGFHLPTAVLNDNTPQRGFSLAESELGISANIDPMFYGAMAFAVHPDNTVSTEEAFIQTTSLPNGFTAKAGRWFSGIGYLNEQHAHAWDFADAPLAYQAFLGGQFNNDGVQVRWLAPMDTFVELGGEVGRGANFPGTDRNKNGSGASAVFVHVGDDIGESSSWRAGFSYLTTSLKGRQWDDTDAAGASVTNDFSGSSRLWVADGVWKWAPLGNATVRNFKLQGEYLRRIESGDLIYNANVVATPGRYDATQSGWYVQGVYQFAPQWRAGLRTERLNAGNVDYGANNAALLRPDYAPKRNALMFDWNPSEFSRVRLQFAQDKSRQGATDNQIFVQYQMSLGAHGAHKF